MRLNISIIIFLMTYLSHSQSLTGRELIGLWKTKNIEIIQDFGFGKEENIKEFKDEIIQHFFNCKIDFSKDGKLTFYKANKVVSRLDYFNEQKWSIDERLEITMTGKTFELWMTTRKKDGKVYFDFFDFMSFQVEKD